MDLLITLRSRAWTTLRSPALATALLTAACVPDLDTDDSTIKSPTLLAVQAEPAEAKQGEAVTYRALFVGSDGRTPGGRLSWFHCEARRPSAELGPVSRECFEAESDKLLSVGRGLEVKGSMPRTACSLFGPNPPLQTGDGPPGRPADPDATGGYKQPVVIGVVPDQGDPSTVLYEQRVNCGLAGVDPQTSGEYNQRYRANVNPAVESIEVDRASGEHLSLAEDATLEVSAGETIEIAARWQACPEVDVCGDGICSIHELAATCEADCESAQPGCAGQEDYLVLDVQTGKLVARRESMSVAWYGTQGAYVDERTGLLESERADRSSNTWTAPASAADVTLWTVVRDARGGVGFRALRVLVR